MTKQNVLISILNWNSGDDTISCLRSISKSSHNNYKIVIIDNASADNSIENINNEFPNIEIIKNSVNLGFAAAQNQGIRLAAERNIEYVWILNNDTTVEPDTLTKLIEELESDKRIGMVSPIILEGIDEKSIQFCGCSANLKDFNFNHFSSIHHAVESQNKHPQLFCLWGTAILARTRLLHHIGCFDDKYFAYYEDLDLSLRVIKDGYINKIVPSAIVRHRGHNDPTKRPPHYVYYNTRNRFFFWKKQLNFVVLIRFFQNYLAGALILASQWKQNGDATKENATLMGVWDAVTSHGGQWEPTRKPPVFLKLLANHPYLFANILRGQLLKSIRGKIFN